MDIKSLGIFIEVAELGSFTKAGEKLGYSQPTISFQIKQLEKEMGVSLFDRIGHTVSLTEAGRDALRYAQSICRLSQEMLLDTSGRREPTGVLRLGSWDIFRSSAKNIRRFCCRSSRVTPDSFYPSWIITKRI